MIKFLSYVPFGNFWCKAIVYDSEHMQSLQLPSSYTSEEGGMTMTLEQRIEWFLQLGTFSMKGGNMHAAYDR
jgi:hypothetical protein